MRKRQKKKNRKRDEVIMMWTLVVDGCDALLQDMKDFNEKLKEIIAESSGVVTLKGSKETQHYVDNAP